jgi:hypothetical protein
MLLLGHDTRMKVLEDETTIISSSIKDQDIGKESLGEEID